jgi:DNA-binding IclR family transcriptional regulator
MIKEVVDKIHSEKNISIDVAFAVDDTLVRIYYRGADETLTYSLPDFSKNSLHNTALGKAYLSSLPDDLIAEKIAAMDLVPKTTKTIVDKTILFEDLQKAKARQYAMSEEEYLPGLITISAPLFDPLTGKGVGAVCFDFSVLQHSADDVEAKYGDMIRDTARMISEILPPDRNRRDSR